MVKQALIAVQALVFLLSAVVTLAVMPALSRRAAGWRLMDEPTARKRHARSTPLVGGLGMLTGLLVTMLVFGLFGQVPLAFPALLLGLLVIGLLDDRKESSAFIRFVAQTVVVMAAVKVSGISLTDVGELVGPKTLHLGNWSLLLSVFGMLGIVNAVNLTDGEDGLAGGISLTALVSFFAALWIMQANGIGPAVLHGYLPMVAALIGAVAGFLVWNLRTPWRRRAAVFMGDAGSLLLGGALGWLAVTTAGQAGQSSPDGFPPAAALWVLIVPLYDTVGCMVRRLLQGQSPMRADRMHLHHLIQAQGVSASNTVLLLIGLNALGGLVGLTSWRQGVPDYVSFVVFLGGFAVYLIVSISYWARQTRRNAIEAARRAALKGVADVATLTAGVRGEGMAGEKGAR